MQRHYRFLAALMTLLLSFMVKEGWGQANLPVNATFSSVTSSGTGTMPTGFTSNGLGGYSGALKFDTQDDWLQLFFNASPGTLTFEIGVNNNFTTTIPANATFSIQESSNGTTWSTLLSYSNVSSGIKTISTLNSASRYIRWYYTTKPSGTNIALKNINLAAAASSPTIITISTPSALSQTSASLDGDVTGAGTAAVTARGIVYSLTSANPNPMIGGTGVTDAPATGTTGAFSVNVSNLAPNTQYSFNAYATNTVGTAYGTAASFYTLANVPGMPLLDGATTTTMDLLIDENGNPSNTHYAIHETTTNKYVQSDGSLGTGAVWQTYSAWTTTVAGLSPNTSYTFEVAARNGANVETTFGPTATLSTLPATAPALTIAGALSESSLNNATISLTLANETFTDNTLNPTNFTLNNAPVGVSIASVDWISATEATLVLAYDDTDFDADVLNFSIIVDGAELSTGANLTSNIISVAAVSELLSAGLLQSFGGVCINTTSTNSVSVTGSGLKSGDVVVGPLTGFSFSTASNGTFSNSLVLSQAGGSFSQLVYVRFEPGAVQSYNGDILVSGAGADAIVIAASANGKDDAPALSTSAATSVSQTSASLPATISNEGCSAITAYGIEYSTTAGFVNGTGTAVAGTNLASGSFDVAVNSLTPNTTYYFKAFASNSGGQTYGNEQSFMTSALSAPLATAATSITSSGFTANWEPVVGATEYRLDVATSTSFHSQQTIASDGFENTSALFTNTGGSFYSGNSVSGDRPASSSFTSQGTYAIGVSNGSLVLTSGDLNTSAFNDVSLSFRLASFSIGSINNGADGGDSVSVEVSPDGGSTYYLTLRIKGNGNAYWDYSATGVATTAYDGNGQPQDFSPASGGSRSTDGYSTVVITNLPASPNLRIKIVAANNSTSERWIIDEFAIQGMLNTSLPTYSDLPVSGTSQAVAGLDPNTDYYYRVRAVAPTSTSANSNIITATTAILLQAPTVATGIATLTNGSSNVALSGTVTANNADATPSFEYGLTDSYGNSIVAAPDPVTGAVSTSITASITGLDANTIYHFRAVATNNEGTGSGNDVTFISPAAVPGTPVLSGETENTIDVAVPNVNGNPSNTEFAIQEVNSGDFVQANGALGSTAVWQTANSWGTVTVNGLLPLTSYEFRSKARNNDLVETDFSNAASTMTTAPSSPVVTLVTSSLTFGDICLNTATNAGDNSFTLNGTTLDGSDISIGALSGFTFSETANGTYTNAITFSYSGNSFTNKEIFVRFTPGSVQSYDGNIQVSGGGTATPVDVAVTGAGINTTPTVSTGVSASFTETSATLAGAITDEGCSAITVYGIEYSTNAGFVGGSGTQVYASNLNAGNFDAGVNNLSASTTYYYKAFATNNGGTTYGAEQSFTTSALSAPVAVAATNLSTSGFTANWNAVNGASEYRLDVYTQTTLPVVETFSGIGGGPINSYLTRTWTGVGGVNWTAYNARTSETLVSGDSAITLRNEPDAYLLSDSIDGNIDTISFQVQRKFSGTTGNLLVSILHGSNFQTEDSIGTYSFNDVIGTISASFTTITGPYKIKILNDGSERVCIDNLYFRTRTTTPVGGYSDFQVNGTSAAISGLNENTTYYYRVRATDGNTTSANSNTISVTTYKDQATANFRTKASGNLSDVNTWEYNYSGNDYVNATISPSADNSVTIQGGHTLSLDDDFTVGSGKTFAIQNSGAMIVAPGKSFIVAGAADFGGQSVTFQSDANATARLGVITGTLDNATNVTVQRYIPAKLVRRYSFVASPVTALLSDSWQQQIHITGPGTGGAPCTNAAGTSTVNSNGFDVTLTNAASMYYYDEATTSKWVSIPNTNATYLTPGAGYRMNVRGDRSQGCALLVANPPLPGAVTLSATGSVGKGTIAVPVATSPTDTAYTFLGNPYPSDISFTAFSATNSNMISPVYWMYDPQTNAGGIFSVYNANLGVMTNQPVSFSDPNIIASGQAFFIENTTHASGNVNFMEAHKTDSTQKGMFKTTAATERIRAVLNTNTNERIDEVVIDFNPNGSASVTPEWDARSLNSGNMIASLKAGVYLAIQSRPELAANSADTVALFVDGPGNSYQLSFTDHDQFSGNVYLLDRFANAIQDVKANTVYPFAITSDPASKGESRFALLFTTGVPLAQNDITLVASLLKGNEVKLSWRTENEANMDSYEVERSADGKHFMFLTRQSAGGTAAAGSYSWTDTQPGPLNYYRIKGIYRSAAAHYSKIVAVKTTESGEGHISIYPNPASGSNLQLQLTGIVAGEYALRLYNTTGQNVYAATVNYGGGADPVVISIPQSLVSGSYRLVLYAGGKEITQPVIINR